jgi:hypothetical protein
LNAAALAQLDLCLSLSVSKTAELRFLFPRPARRATQATNFQKLRNGTMLANAPGVFLAKALSEGLPRKTNHHVACELFFIPRTIFISRAPRHPS